ncbi:MAG: hypothetical protein KKB20_20485 [Proteobacteria bacterium]|nr:hypothetical protein [Pseudomonadota bacterium]
MCQKCGRPLAPGELAYQVRIELVSTFDGYIEEPDLDIDMELERLIEAVARQSPGEAAKDVAQTIDLVICRGCRNRLVAEYDVQAEKILH